MSNEAWDRDYEWLADFWNVVMAPGRIWRVYAPSDVFDCEGSALILLRDRLRARGEGVEWRYVHAWGTEPEIPFGEMSERDVFFIGRTRLFHASRVGLYAHKIDDNVRGKFIDGPQGTLGDSLRYGRRLFKTQRVDIPPLVGHCTVDYGILSFCKTEVGFGHRALIGVSGITPFATWAMMRVLTDDARRAQLVKDVQAIAPWVPGLRPDEGFEICVRFAVDDDEQLMNLLNDESFKFRVEAVVLGGGDLHLRDHGVEIVLRPDPDGEGGSITAGPMSLDLRDYRFRLLQVLVESGRPMPTMALCDRLGFLERSPSPDDIKRAKGRVGRAVCDLNKRIRKLIPGFREKRPLSSGRGGYRLVGLRGVVDKERSGGTNQRRSA